jgi:hypothetical protein
MVVCMSARERRIEAEAAALWRELYDEPAPASADAHELLDAMLRRLPAVDYERLSSPHLRRGNLTFPKRRARSAS